MHLKFVTGSISKHLLTLMFASWVALASGMLLSLADMYFLSRLNDLNVLAAVGFSGSIIMFPISIGIGFSIAISVLVSQALGRDGKRAASKIFSSLLIIAMGLSVFIMGFLLLNVDFFLDALGASGEVKALAISYLSITLYSSPFAVLLMALASGLRSLALAKASMLISLLATVINFVLDPILIEVMGFGIQGAAWATVIARLIATVVGVYFLSVKIGFISLVTMQELRRVFIKAKSIALPAVVSNLFTPIGGMIVVSVVSGYGSEAMAGLAVVGSLSPILFSVYFSLTGAAGPMIGQNIGAGKPERVASIYRHGLVILSVYTSITWIAMMLLYPLLLVIFQLKGVAGELLHLYCFVQVPLSLGLGFIALSNSIYNNLGKPKWSMWLNITRSSIVTYCLCHLGAYYFGVLGAVMASTTSFVIYGLVGVYLALKLYHDRFSLPLLLKPKNQIPTA